jgi:hypothetical protein
MQTAEFNHEDFSTPRAGDEKLAVRFFIKAKQDQMASQEAQRPIFKEHEYIQIMVPGDRNQTIVRPITPPDRERFAKQYAHWKTTQSNELVQGTPLEAWNTLSLAQIEEYRYFGIRTIEQMADLRDDVCQKITGATSLKQKAQVFMQLAKDEAPMKRVQAELDKRDNELETLRQAIADQAKIIAGLQAGQVAAAATVNQKSAKKA